jgi:hypothetical protein
MFSLHSARVVGIDLISVWNHLKKSDKEASEGNLVLHPPRAGIEASVSRWSSVSLLWTESWKCHSFDYSVCRTSSLSLTAASHAERASSKSFLRPSFSKVKVHSRRSTSANFERAAASSAHSEALAPSSSVAWVTCRALWDFAKCRA